MGANVQDKLLVEVDLPSTLPLEERIRLAKAHILQDFKQAAQQQEFEKVTGGFQLKIKEVFGDNFGVLVPERQC